MTLLVAPPGSRKSTEIRKAAVKYVLENPGKTVMLLLPRHHLVDEQIKALHAEHPGKPFRAAIWRGMHREDPEFIGPLRPGEDEADVLARRGGHGAGRGGDQRQG